MKDELDGPVLAALVHRLSECPGEFLQEPRVEQRDGAFLGTIHVDAVASDVIRSMGGSVPPVSDTKALRRGRGRSPANHLRLALVACWVLGDRWFEGRRGCAERVLDSLVTRLAPLADVVPAADFVSDPDRREELVRACLAHLDLRPSGEGVADAADCLAALDSVERARVVRDARRAEERARAIREAMAKKEAEEAAARYGRE